MIAKSKNIGIWGFGVVGAAALLFFHRQGTKKLYVLDNAEPTPNNYQLLKQCNAFFIKQSDEKSIKDFFKKCDYLLASPGINLNPYVEFLPPILTEADIFFNHYRGTIIGVTGTVGKTTITALLGSLLNDNSPTLIGGNIGLGMLNLLHFDQQIERTVLELSSFQLDRCQEFAPDIALITNIYPNHLDRHLTMDNYINAKIRIFAHQKSHQHLVLPLHAYYEIVNRKISINSRLHIIADHEPTFLERSIPFSSWWWLDSQGNIKRCNQESIDFVLSGNELPLLTYLDNWMLVLATLNILDIPYATTKWKEKGTALLEYSDLSPGALSEHRLEKIATIGGVDIYNDSKSTVMEATLAAVGKLSARPIILLIGGLSKGVDRSALLSQLKNKVKHIICFGVEAEFLAHAAQSNNILSASYGSLEEAYGYAISIAQPRDQILFSPGGASFDLFSNYQARGTYFKSLVMKQDC